jgi:hypothetical protein
MNKGIKAFLFFSIVLTLCVVVAGLRDPDSAARHAPQENAADESQFPIAEETAPGLATSAERIKKNKKEKKYGKYKDTIGPGVTVASVHYHWPPGFPTLPVGQSDAVILGEVTDTKAYVTDDKSTVYSEFTVRITKVLRDDARAPLPAGGSIVMERPGGRVRYSTGHISRFSLTGLGMPRMARQYVLFLTGNSEDQSYHLVTGYELLNGHVFPLDKTTSSQTDFDAYVNMDEAAFLKQLDAAIAMSSSADPE